MVNWHLLEYGIHWLVSCDHIVASGLDLTKVIGGFQVDRWPATVFRLDRRLTPG